MPPNPSTVPIRVRAAMTASGAPARIRSLDWATLGKFSGQVSSGTSRMGVENCERRWSSQASMAGHRLLRAGGDVPALVVEAAVAADPIGDERFGDVVVGQQLGLGELGLRGGHRFGPLGVGHRGPPGSVGHRCRRV